jgi:hypothetical protein
MRAASWLRLPYAIALAHGALRHWHQQGAGLQAGQNFDPALGL